MPRPWGSAGLRPSSSTGAICPATRRWTPSSSTSTASCRLLAMVRLLETRAGERGPDEHAYGHGPRARSGCDGGRAVDVAGVGSGGAQVVAGRRAFDQSGRRREGEFPRRLFRTVVTARGFEIDDSRAGQHQVRAVGSTNTF